MKYIYYIILIVPSIIFSQEKISGVIFEDNANNETILLAGANVYWLNSSIGTVTDIDGKFTLEYTKAYSKLVISHIGYMTDTLIINKPQTIRHGLKATSTLEEVIVETRKQSTTKSYINAQNVYNVSSDELLKAACCNLSESFETNPSIDVNFADAISGTRQIKMLGLTSPYILITTENVPTIRGAAQAYGLTFTPGTWVESIQITKGAGSVVNGFESIAGQINVELQKPTKDNKLLINAFANAAERFELNAHYNTALNKSWSTGLYIHGSTLQRKHDVNNDGFMDMPNYKQINVMNRWQYTNQEKGIVSFINLRILDDKKQAGQVDFNPQTDKLTTNFWGSEINTRRYDISTKFGYVNPEITWQSIGVQAAYSSHQQESYFGIKTYDIQHNSFYFNGIYNSIIGDTRHKIKTGLSFTHDDYNEIVNSIDFARNENSLGGFFEYAYDSLEDFSLTAGLRLDYHNLLGVFITPRLHLRYSPWEKAALRGSIGRGKRSANIFAENQNIFATSRVINISNSGGEIYGLDPEIAWNFGISFLQGFNLFNKKADITLDFYRTDFTNQVVVDYETPTEINFYNLEGESYANSFQAEFNYNPFKQFDVRLAYKYYDVETQYNSGKLQKPLTPRHRFFANASFTTLKTKEDAQWKFDATYNWVGQQRFSSTQTNPAEFQLSDYSTTIATLNAQITKVFSSVFEIYFGGENINNVKQDNPILSSDDPFGDYFDSTFVYGPIFGSNYYVGLRYKLN